MATWTQPLQHWWRARQSARRMAVGTLLAQRTLSSLFQPMVDLRSGQVFGHEALVRPPRSVEATSAFHLLEAAREQRCELNLELGCLDQALEQWLAERARGYLFVNISAPTLIQMHKARATDELLQILRKHRVQPKRLGLDLSNYTRVANLDTLVRAIKPLREAGMLFALDDFKASESSLKVWSTVLPNLLKLAPRWTQDIESDPDAVKVVRSLVRLTHGHGSTLVAKAVESESQLRAMQGLGVGMAQGYFLGSPAPEPVTSLNLRARSVLEAVAV